MRDLTRVACLLALAGITAACSACAGGAPKPGGAEPRAAAHETTAPAEPSAADAAPAEQTAAAAKPAAAPITASVPVALSLYTLEVGGVRVSETGRMKRSDLAQHTVGDRALVKLLPAMRAATAKTGADRVRAALTIEPKTPLWFVEIAVGALFWDDRVAVVVVAPPKGGGQEIVLRRPPAGCADASTAHATAGLLVRDRDVLAVALATDAAGAVPCGTPPGWHLSKLSSGSDTSGRMDPGEAPCSSFALSAAAETVRQTVASAQGHGESAGAVAVHALGEATWASARPVLEALGERPELWLVTFAAPEGCAPEPAAEERVDSPR